MTDLRKDNRGAALVWVLLTLTLAGILSTGLMMLIVNRARTQSVDVDKTKEYYVADGVAELVRTNNGSEIEDFVGSAPLSERPEDDASLPDGPAVYFSGNAAGGIVIYYGPHYVTQITWTGESYTVTQTPRTLPQGGDGE